MKIPVILLLFILFLVLMSYKRNRHTKKQENVTENYLSRELSANATRRKDISTLDYINLDMHTLPIGVYDDPSLKEAESLLLELSEKRIINLSDKTNTDLKLLYGPANLDLLTEYDENFVSLTKTLVSYAETLESLGFTKDAVSVLEYGISIQSEITQNYLSLAKLYTQCGCKEKISTLFLAVENLSTPFAQSLKEKLSSDYEEPSSQTFE